MAKSYVRDRSELVDYYEERKLKREGDLNKCGCCLPIMFDTYLINPILFAAVLLSLVVSFLVLFVYITELENLSHDQIRFHSYIQ